MELLKLMKERYSARSYSIKKVEKEKLQYILEAGRVAPTAANTQTPRILVVESAKGLEKLAKSARIYNPPIILVICSVEKDSWINPFDGRDMNDIDCSIISTHMMLAARELGVDSVWINWFDPEILYKELDIPREYKIVNLLALGYSDKEAPSPNRHDMNRKPLSETVFYERF